MAGSNHRPLACKASALPAELILRYLGSVMIRHHELNISCIVNGDPYGIRTRVTAVKGRCLNHLTNGPMAETEGFEPSRRLRDLHP